MSLAPTSLRERKKAHTRRRLIEASQRLFRAHGYAAVTLEQVAAEVDVHVKTLLRYFSTKQDLALALEYQAHDHWYAGLSDEDRQGFVVDYYCDFMHSLALDWVADLRQAERLDYVLMLQSDPSTAGAALRLSEQYEDDLAAAIAAEAGIESFDLYSRMLASMLVRTMDVIVRQWAADPDGFDLVRNIADLKRFCRNDFPARPRALRRQGARRMIG